MPARISWHVPTVFSYRVNDPSSILNVIFLQRMTEAEIQEVKATLESVDQKEVEKLNIEQHIGARSLHIKKWIRDYAPSSATVLQIAKTAHEPQYTSDHRFASLVLVDSAWDLGNVIAAHWERQSDGEARLSAARVPTGIANVLLAACDRVDGLNLSQALGTERYEQSKIDLYKDLGSPEAAENQVKATGFKWPAHLPGDLNLDRSSPFVISLRTLDESAIQKLRDEIHSGANGDQLDVQIYNWEGDTNPDRLYIRELYKHMLRNGIAEDNECHYAWFVDYFGRNSINQPQIIAVSNVKRDPGEVVEVLPIFTHCFPKAWQRGARGETLDDAADVVDIWKEERIDDISNAVISDTSRTACQIFFLQPFTQEEEQRAREAVCALGNVEEGEDWGHLFIWHGYLFQDGKKHTLEDLRDLFEASDPMSPSYDRKKAGPLRLSTYPSNFAALDEKVLDTEQPKVWMASSLDFHGEDTSDQLGWTIGRLDAAQTSITFVNLDIANIGPEECFDEETIDKLWLSDLAGYREEDWKCEQEI